MATKKDEKKVSTTNKRNSSAINNKKTTKSDKEVKKVTKKSEKVTSKSKATSAKSNQNKVTSESSSNKTTRKSNQDKTTSKKTTSSKANAKKSSSKVTKNKKLKNVEALTAKPMLAEYYDLPYRYNETVVKILAQTPTTLFVYWDISDDDRNSLINAHGENFFYETKPILVIHNITKNYSFEVEINDFANSWYIRTQEPNCNYVIELGRKAFNKPEEYIYIDSSNEIVSPNDHILFEKSNLGNVLFRNVKTNVLSSKDFGSLRFINDIDKLYGNLYDVYSKLYNDETLNELGNPTSGEFIRK